MDIRSATSLPLTASAVPGLMAQTQSPLSATFQKITQSQEYAKKRARAEDAAAGLVSNALIMPMLKQLRHSTLNSKGPFSPGTGEKAFGPEFDMQISDSIAHSPRLGIKEALADRLMNSGTPAAATKRMDVHG